MKNLTADRRPLGRPSLATRYPLATPKHRIAFVDSIIQDGRKFTVWRFTVHHTCEPNELEATLRRAIRDWIMTKRGTAQAVQNRNDFNWGDACVGIPAWFWKKYGILSFLGEDPSIPRLVVDHDESFFARWAVSVGAGHFRRIQP